jgi:hypothetical protein
MDSLALLINAHAAGLQVRAEGERLIVRGPKRLTALAQQLLSQKAEVLEALEAFEERAAIMEYDGGLARAEAERLAWELVTRPLSPDLTILPI